MGWPIFSPGKEGLAHSFPGEKTDWGEIPACMGSVTWAIIFLNFSNWIPVYSKTCLKKPLKKDKNRLFFQD